MFLETIPDDVQQIIFGYLEPSVRLGMLKQKYSPEFMTQKMSQLPETDVIIKKLFAIVQHAKPILIKYLNHNGDIYRNIKYFIEECIYYPKNLDYFIKNPMYCRYLIEIIIVCVKNYTKMYKQTKNSEEICNTEKQMIKIYSLILSL